NRRQDHRRRSSPGFNVVTRSLTSLPPLAPIDYGRLAPLDRELRCAQPARGRSHCALRLAPLDRELRCAQPARGRSHTRFAHAVLPQPRSDDTHRRAPSVRPTRKRSDLAIPSRRRGKRKARPALFSLARDDRRTTFDPLSTAAVGSCVAYRRKYPGNQAATLAKPGLIRSLIMASLSSNGMKALFIALTVNHCK